MNKRREFLIKSSLFTTGALMLPDLLLAKEKKQVYGVQLYSFRDDFGRV